MLVGKLGLRLGPPPDVLKLVEHPRRGSVAVAEASGMNDIAAPGPAWDPTAHATAPRLAGIRLG